METRRNFLKSVTIGTCALCASSYRRLWADDVSPSKPLFSPGEYSRINSTERTYHISCEIDMFDQYDSLLDVWKDAGVTDAWLGVWYYGHFPYPWDKFDYWLFQLKEHGFRPHLGSVPFCHGGGSLDPLDSEFPNLPPKHWTQ